MFKMLEGNKRLYNIFTNSLLNFGKESSAKYKQISTFITEKETKFALT